MSHCVLGSSENPEMNGDSERDSDGVMQTSTVSDLNSFQKRPVPSVSCELLQLRVGNTPLSMDSRTQTRVQLIFISCALNRDQLRVGSMW